MIMLISILLFFFSSSARAVENAKPADGCTEAKEIINHYIDLDSKGETTHTSRLVDDLIDFEGGDMPAWDTVYVTKDAKVSSCKREKNKATVTTIHTVIGTLSSGGVSGEYPIFEAYHPVKTEITSMQLKLNGKNWKINFRTVRAPHVSVPEIIKQLEARLENKKSTPEVEAKTKLAIQKLKAAVQ